MKLISLEQLKCNEIFSSHNILIFSPDLLALKEGIYMDILFFTSNNFLVDLTYGGHLKIFKFSLLLVRSY